MREPSLIWCGPDRPPRGIKRDYKRTIELNSHPENGNVNLKISNISSRLAQNIPEIVLDLLEIGAYVYCADQTLSRGGTTFRKDGKKWYRDFEFNIAVRCLDIWEREDVQSCLCETLGFLTDDNYRFDFRKLTIPLPWEPYFEFGDEQPWFKADEVLLFSGGLDSLAGAVDEIVALKKRVLLVGHRPVAVISTRQKQLVEHLSNLVDVPKSLIHIPIWVNKDQGLTKDANQRARSFLYASLGAAVSVLNKSTSIKIYENGIVSTNLPISGQVIGSRASRSTHPRVLRGFSELFSLVLECDYEVSNPFFVKTKSDVVESLCKNGGKNLIRLTSSCSRTRSATRLRTHCGVCSQCIERRLATLHNQVGKYDPGEMYQTDLFLDSIENADDRTMVVSYVSHCQNLENISPEDFFARFPEALRLLKFLNQSTDRAANCVLDLHRRHGRQVAGVINEQIKINAEPIRLRQLRPNSLLRMIVGETKGPKKVESNSRRFPTPEGTDWDDITIEIVSNESLKVRVGSCIETYMAHDIGFLDGRKRDLLNNQWKTLKAIAYCNGVLEWNNPLAIQGNQKSMQALRQILQNLTGITSDPFHRYKKATGWVAKFKISDKRY